MSIEDNKDVARRYMQAVVDGDIETIDALQHPECKWWILGYGEMDRATFIGMVREGLLSAKQRNINILALTAEDDRVAVMAEGEMIFDDSVYRNSYHNMLYIRDGQIVAGREYMDTKASSEAFSAE
jgi:ketosteroid isomerase-like protein